MPDALQASAAGAARDLIAWATDHGEALELNGAVPLLLDDPAAAYVVLRGEVDLFLVEVADGEAAGPRFHLFTQRAGEPLFGLDGDAALSPVGVLAVGCAGSAVVRVELAALRRAGDDPALREALARGIDHWTVGLSQALAAPVAPRPRTDAALTPGETLAVRGGQRIGAGHDVAWPVLPRGEDVHLLYLDTEEVVEAAAGVAPPLTRASWLGLSGDMTLSAIGTAAALDSGACWSALAALHRLALDAAPINLRLAAADETNRLRRQRESDGAAGRAAFERLAAALTEGRRGGARDLAASVGSADPLTLACVAVAQAMGVTLVPPAAAPGDDGRPPTLDDIARANRLRVRRAVLDDGWSRHDVGPFLLRREGDGRPLAVTPRGLRGGYLLYDPVEGTERLLTARQAAALRGEATVFTAALPSAALRGRDLLGLGLRWASADVFSLAGLSLAGALLSMGPPIATGFLVESVIPAHDLPKLAEMATVLLLAAAALLTTRYAVQIAFARIEARVGARVQAGVMDRLLRLPTGFFKDYMAGDLAKRALTVRAIQQAVGASLISSLTSAVFAVSSVGLMIWYSPLLALVGVGLLALLAVLVVWLGLARARRERSVLSAEGEAAGLLLQIANGVGKLRLARAEDRAFLRWARRRGDAARHAYQAGVVADLAALIGGSYGPLATAALFVAIHQFGLAAGGGLALGAALAFLSAFSQALGGFVGLAQTVVQLAALRPAYAYAAPILETVPEADAGKLDPGPLTGRIDIDHVSFRYDQRGPLALRDLSLSVAAGECVALVGPSGCGKSTLLRLLLGFERPESGAVLFDGCDLSMLDVQAVRRQFGVVLQNDQLTPGSLLDNILGPNLHLGDAEAWAAAERVGLADDIRAMPMGMRTVISDGGGGLSGGQTQRVLLARAIVGGPRFLLLDEATSALDNVTQAKVADSLDRLTATRLVIAHRLSTVRNADRILVLKDGGVAEVGTYDALMARGGLFHDMAQRQLA